MRNPTINTLIDDFNSLELNDKEFALGIIRKMLVEAKRDAIARKTKSAIANLKKGKVKRGTYKDLYKDLEND